MTRGPERTLFSDDIVNPRNRYGWKDKEGPVVPKTSGLGAPSLTAYRGGNVREFAFAAGDDYDYRFHIPHDWAPGTDMFIHVHWSHNGTNIAGSLVMNHYVTYAKGHGQAGASGGTFHAEKNITQTVANLTITNTPQYLHRVDEVPLMINGGSGSLIDTSLIEVDGLIMGHFDVTTIPTITGGAGKPFIHFIDLHYQADRVATRRRSPNFYDE